MKSKGPRRCSAGLSFRNPRSRFYRPQALYLRASFLSVESVAAFLSASCCLAARSCQHRVDAVLRRVVMVGLCVVGVLAVIAGAVADLRCRCPCHCLPLLPLPLAATVVARRLRLALLLWLRIRGRGLRRRVRRRRLRRWLLATTIPVAVAIAARIGVARIAMGSAAVVPL